MHQHFTTLNPPSTNEAPTENQSKLFLNLLKSLERATIDDQDSKDIESKVLDTLSNMIPLYQNRGLFTSTQSRAKHAPSPDSGTRGSGSAKKRKRGGASGSSGKIASILNLDGSNSCEEAYVLSNLSRVIIPCSERGLVYPPSVLAFAANAMDAICQYCIANSRNNFLVEQEMIGSIASQLISGLGKTMKYLVEMVAVDEALVACCNCTKSIIIITNTKLSRNGSIIAAIQNVAQEILKCDDSGSVEISGAVESAAGLIASIPLVGNSNGVPPMKLWSEMLLQQTMELQSTIQAFFPLVKKLNKGRSSRKDDDLEWITETKNTVASQASRLVLFFARVKGIVAVLTKLMEMDGYNMSNAADGAAVPITALLDISDQMLLFSPIAETRFLATKSRLRDISIEGGLLSPNAAVMVGNSMKYLGVSLFESVILSLSTTALQYGKKIMTIAVNNLQSCSTLTLKRVIDSSSNADKNSMKKWLYSSVQLRTRSIEAFTLVVQRLGANASVTQNDLVNKALAFVAGCLLEQISTNDQFESLEDEHWGSEEERAELVVACCEALSTSLNVFGGYLTMHNRELIESIASTCLSNIDVKKSHSGFCNFASVKVMILQLSVSCVANAWPDGASSGLVETLRRTALVMRFDTNRKVSSAAYSAMSICNTSITPRAPPLVIISRANDADVGMINKNSQFFSREFLEDGMNAVGEDLLKAKIVERERSKKSRQDDTPASETKVKKESIKTSLKKVESNETTRVEVKETTETARKTKNVTVNENENKLDNMQHESNNSIPDVDESMDIDIEEKEIDMKLEDDASDDSDEGVGSDDDFPPIVDCAPDDEDM